MPDGWRRLTLGTVAKYVNGRAFKPSEWKKEGLPIVRIQNLNNPQKEFNYYDGESEPKHWINNGDILISWSASLGVYVWNRGPALLNQHIFKVLPNGSLVDKRYFVYAVRTILDQMKSRVHGSTMRHIVKGDFQTLEIPVPPLATQERIADVLERGERLKRLREEATQLTNKIIQSVFLKMFGGAVTAKHDWSIMELGEVCSKITDGTHDLPDLSDSGVPLISAKNVRDDYIDFSDVHFISKSTDSRLAKRCKPQKGDLLLVCVGHTIGRNALVVDDRDFNIFRSVALIRPNTKFLDPHFLRYAVNSPDFQEQIRNHRNTSGQPGLYIRSVESLRIAIPPLEIQSRFATAAQKFQTIQNQQLRSYQEINELFRSLMQKAFRGDLKRPAIKENSNWES